MKTALDRPSCVHMGYRQYHLHFVAPIYHLDTRGNPRTPCTGTEGRSAAAARLTALGYRNQSTVRRRRPILATGRFMRPLTRQNHHSGCSMLIGCDAHNQNTFRDPKKQKPPRPESG